MTTSKLQGVIAAIATAVDEQGEPDCARSTALARFLLANGCDGLNVLGTTGEATSFSLEQRKRGDDRLSRRRAAARSADGRHRRGRGRRCGRADPAMPPSSDLPARWCCRRSTTRACPDDGLAAYVDDDRAGDRRTADPDLSLSLPGQSGLPWHVEADPPPARRPWRAHRRLEGFLRRHGLCARGRGDRARFSVFPSTEAVLMEARAGAFAGCISATANLNADLCARAWRSGDAGALDAAVTIRKLFDGKPLVRASRRCSRISTAMRLGTGRAAPAARSALPSRPTAARGRAGYAGVRAQKASKAPAG